MIKLSIVGSIKIDSWQRKKIFVDSLVSLEPILPVLLWNINIVGKYADFSKKKILALQKDAIVACDDNSPYYEIIKKQIDQSQSNFIFFWQEDHWFVCPNKNLFLYLLQEFSQSKAEILTISHLVASWETGVFLPVINQNHIYKEYKIDLNSQKKLWEMQPNSYLTGIPAIYKKELAKEILEFNKPHLSFAKDPHEYELSREKGESFLQNRSYIEMIPNFHVFREVFRFYKNQRAITIKKALQILKLRKDGSF